MADRSAIAAILSCIASILAGTAPAHAADAHQARFGTSADGVP